jgi:hypothetical protein
MKRYAILPSTCNEVLLSYLGIPYEKASHAIYFEADVERDLHRIARAIIVLGYAHNDAQALALAASFFLNEVR